MAKCRPSVGTILGGALVGAALTLLLIPESRRMLRRAVRNWIRDLQLEDQSLHVGVEEEAGATEGGLAATRGWNT